MPSKNNLVVKSTRNNRKRYLVWLKQADYDLSAAKVSRDKGYYEWACFQSQQALEKFLKSVLVHAGWRPPKIHKLGILMGLCNDANPEFAKIKINFHAIESFTFVSRYPFLIPGQNNSPHEFITQFDAEDCIAIVDKASEVIKSLLKNTGPFELREMIIPKFTEIEVNRRLDLVTDSLVRNFELERIILFGSFARNKIRNRDRTMDLLIVANTELQFFERIKKVKDLISGGEPIIEPLVYTPAEFDELLNDEGEGFLETAIEEGVVIYTKEEAV